MIEGYRPGPVRVDPVGVAPAEVVAQALRCERLEAALAELLSVAERMRGGDPSLDPEEWYAIRDYARIQVAAGATGKAGT